MPAYHEGTSSVQSAEPGPETTGRHRCAEGTPPLPEAGRHRSVAASPLEPAGPARRERPRGRHAADTAPPTHPDARARRRWRAPWRIVAGATLLTIAVAPVLARSASGQALHDAVTAELAAHRDQTEDALDARGRGGDLVGSGAAGRTAARQPAAPTAASPSAGTPRARGAPSISSRASELPRTSSRQPAPVRERNACSSCASAL